MRAFFKKEKVSIIVAVLVLAFSALACVARYIPFYIGDVLEVNADPVKQLYVSDATNQINCTADRNGAYTINGGDPQILFSVNQKEIESISLTLATPATTPVNFEVYTAEKGESFTAQKCYFGCVFTGETTTVIDIPKSNLQSLRLDIDDDDNVILASVDLYNEQPNTVPYKPKQSGIDLACAIVIPIICAVVAFLLNKKFKLGDAIVEAVKKGIKPFLKFAAASVVALPISALVEWVLCNVERSGNFNVFRWLFFFGALELLIALFLLKNSLAKEPEKLFLVIVLIVGLVMVFGSPIQHICWDLDSHYPWAVHTSYSKEAYLTGADVCVDKLVSQTMIDNNFNLETYKSDLQYLESKDNLVVKEAPAQFNIAHLPAGIIISIARLFGIGFAARYNLGRLTYLLVFALVSYFAIKKIKSGKMILATICLFPTVLFMATNYAYDSWVVAFSALGMAYYVNILQEPEKPISICDTVIMCAAFALAALPKLVYVLLMGIPFFVYKKWKSRKEVVKYYSILVIVFAIVFAIFAITSLTKVSGSGDARGGNVNPGEQIKFILTNPVDYAKILIKFLRKYLSIDETRNYISNFAYLGTGKWWPVFVMLLGVTALTDTKEGLRFKIPFAIKFLSIVFFVGVAALIATALYIDFTPVANQGILGCQPRYIIPLLAPLLLLVTGQRKDIIKEKGAYNGFVLVTATFATMSDVYFSIISRMI